jgi:hypothetical protein
MDALARRTQALLALRVWSRFLLVAWVLRREPLPQAVARLGTASGTSPIRVPDARRLSRVVQRSLTIGSAQPRCIFQALTLYRLLREQGLPAALVIGLPDDPQDHKAHAWVELDGRDVGPAPGSRGHRELTRYA